MRLRVLLVGFAAAIVGGLFVPTGSATTECRGIKDCVSVPGPWVIVPAHSEATYLLQCPGLKGIVGGLDAVATSPQVRATFEGRLGSPVAPGTTTTRFAIFHAQSSSDAPQSFRPYIGCIPTSGGGSRSTTSARATAPGAPFDFWMKQVAVTKPTQIVTSACKTGEKLVSAWKALVFDSPNPPDATLAARIRIALKTAPTGATATITVVGALPAGVHPEVQVVAVCG